MGRRRVVLITADQLRADALNFDDSSIVRAPHLRSVARDGVMFAQHYSVTAPCGPSRTSLLTGTYPFVHGSVHARAPFDGNRTNLAFEARKRGLRPVLIGYTDTNVEPLYPDGTGVMPGFEVEVYFNLSDFGLAGWRARLAARGLCENFFGSGSLASHESTDAGSRYADFLANYSTVDGDTAYVADAAIDFINEHAAEAFLLHVSFLRPHPPLVAPERFSRLYQGVALRPPSRRQTRAVEASQHPYLAFWLKQHERPGYFDPRIDAGGFDDAALDPARATYFSLVSEVDHHIGRIVDALKRADIWEDTLFVFTSDHGEMLGDHWCLGKGGYFDASYRVPLIIRDPLTPNANRYRTVSHFTESVDIVPTILEWLDGPVTRFNGTSLLSLLKNPNAEPVRPFAYFEYDFRSFQPGETENALGIGPEQCNLQVIRDQSHKYVAFHGLPPLLFDLKSDPCEFRNILEVDREAPAIAARYVQALSTHRALHNSF
jgi:arylsulfatase A-like enzyme